MKELIINFLGVVSITMGIDNLVESVNKKRETDSNSKRLGQGLIGTSEIIGGIGAILMTTKD